METHQSAQWCSAKTKQNKNIMFTDDMLLNTSWKHIKLSTGAQEKHVHQRNNTQS